MPRFRMCTLARTLTHALTRALLSFPRALSLDAAADSTLVTRQMRGEWGCAAPGLVPLRAAAAAAARSFDAVDFTYIPRAQNARVRPARSSVRVPRQHQRQSDAFCVPIAGGCVGESGDGHARLV